ncbi:MAG: hypothetical protein M0002_15255 [Rhodospirillales bacterium]|nr:hypothetical protein [Rhodospirillales bacterium]
MSLALTPPSAGRTTRLTALVSEAEAQEVARMAKEAGLSISAYLRGCALKAGAPAGAGDDAPLRQADALIARMEADLDGAIAALARIVAA